MTTTEIVKLSWNHAGLSTISVFIILALFFLLILWEFINSIMIGDYYYTQTGVFLLVPLLIPLIFLGVNIFTPLTLTKKTEVKTNEFSIIRVEGKISDSGKLNLLVKSNEGEISTRNLNINDKNTIVKMSGKDESYTEKVTQITYSTKQKINAWVKNVPKNETKKESTVHLRGNYID